MGEDLAIFAVTHPFKFCLSAAGVALLVVLWYSLRTAVMREAVRKFWYLSRNNFNAEVGWKNLVYWLVAGALIATPVALKRGYGKDGDNQFHWGEFFAVLVIVGVSNVVRVVIEGLWEKGFIFRPVHGRRWRQERKIATAAILKKVNLSSPGRAEPLPKAELQKLLTDLLDVVVSHVRDHRGQHRGVDVFANLLLVSGEDVIVVARDSTLQHRDFKREVPVRYKLAGLAVGRAIASKQVVSVGDVRLEYPEAPKNKPYRSILAIPLISSTNPDRVIGALSIDSTTPYFFESFHPGVTQNTIDDNLAPYVHTLTLILETLVSRDPADVLALLC